MKSAVEQLLAAQNEHPRSPAVDALLTLAAVMLADHNALEMRVAALELRLDRAVQRQCPDQEKAP